MSKFYRKLQKTAARIIKDKGGSFDVKRLINCQHDPVTGQAVCEEDIKPFDMAILPPSGDAETYVVDGSSIQLWAVRDVIISMLDSPFRPERLNQVFFEDEWWILEAVTPIAPNAKVDVVLTGFIRRA